jgi:hypothetical protein
MGPIAPPRHGARLLVLALAALVATPAAAQTFGVEFGANVHGGFATARVHGLRYGQVTLDAYARAGDLLAAGVTWRWAQVYGALGNVIIEGGVEGLTALTARDERPDALRASLGVRGVLGGVAAALRLDAGLAPEGAFDGGGRAERPRAALSLPDGRWDVGVRASATYRVDRRTILTVEPRLRYGDGAWAAFGASTLRLSNLRPEVDFWLGAEAGLVAGSAGGGGAGAGVGVGAIWSRRREPDSWLRLWLGADGDGLRPGLEGLAAVRSGASTTTITAALVPHRLEQLPWRVTIEVAGVAAGPGTVRLRGAVAGDASAEEWSFAVTWEQPLRPPR